MLLHLLSYAEIKGEIYSCIFSITTERLWKYEAVSAHREPVPGAGSIQLQKGVELICKEIIAVVIQMQDV